MQNSTRVRVGRLSVTNATDSPGRGGPSTSSGFDALRPACSTVSPRWSCFQVVTGSPSVFARSGWKAGARDRLSR